MTKKLLLILMVSVMLGSCGQSHKAKSLAKDFIVEHQVEGDRFNMSFSKLDSTKRVNDSTVAAMRQHVTTLPQFKPGITFEDGDIPATLLYITARYTILTPKGDTLHCDNTFYMDKDMRRLIAVK